MSLKTDVSSDCYDYADWHKSFNQWHTFVAKISCVANFDIGYTECQFWSLYAWKGLFYVHNFLTLYSLQLVSLCIHVEQLTSVQCLFPSEHVPPGIPPQLEWPERQQAQENLKPMHVGHVRFADMKQPFPVLVFLIALILVVANRTISWIMMVFNYM